MSQLFDQVAAAASALALSFALIAGTVNVPVHSSQTDTTPAATQEII